MGIDRLDFADVADIPLDLRIDVVRGRSQYERKLRNDSELLHPLGELQNGAGVLRPALVHYSEHIIGARFGSEKDHFAPAVAHLPPGCVRKLHQSVRPGFTPPGDAAALKPPCNFSRTMFSDEEVVIDELDCVDAILIPQPKHFVRDRRCGFSSPASLIDGSDRAETAQERAAKA